MDNRTTVNPRVRREPTLLVALMPVVFLVALLAYNVFVFGDDGISGSTQIVIIVATCMAVFIAIAHGVSWNDLQTRAIENITIAMPSILIILMIGALSGAWLLGGVVPAMVYYGLGILNPEMFLFAACILCAAVSLMIGSSWTTVATVGIALLSIGKALGLHEGFIAGAIISGAYFGDKLSPLSDTTNLAPAVAGTDLYTHIRYMMKTTIPSITIALLLFLLLGFFYESSANPQLLLNIRPALESTFTINPVLLLVPVVMIYLIYRRMPPVPAMFVGTVLGLLAAVFIQGEKAFVTEQTTSPAATHYYYKIVSTLYGATHFQTGNSSIDSLFSASGMSGMLGTIWLIIAAMVFGGVMERSGMLQVITLAIASRARSAFSLVATTVASCLFTNATASDQYISIVMPGRMFITLYKKKHLAPQNLSRTLEDSGTVTSVLVPWNTCGAYHAGVLGVSTLTYAPFAFFCILSPLMTLIVFYFNVGICVEKVCDKETASDNKTVSQTEKTFHPN